MEPVILGATLCGSMVTAFLLQRALLSACFKSLARASQNRG
jgi:hypothetical protein